MAKIVILTGAGISAESGISTFRDSGGLWEEYDLDKVCKVGCLVNNRNQTLEFYDKRRAELETKEPNKAHKIIAKLKNEYKNEIAIITQNVDNLFEKAGIIHKDVIHLHGFLTEIRCENCDLIYDIGYKKIQDTFNGKCPECYSKNIRPNIVMFGEKAIMYKVLDKELENCELLVVIGTSGKVIEINTMAKYINKSILNNLEKNYDIDDKFFNKSLYKPATEAIEEIEVDIRKYLENS